MDLTRMSLEAFLCKLALVRKNLCVNSLKLGKKKFSYHWLFLIFMNPIKKCYDSSRKMPFVLKTVLTANGWTPYNKKKFDQLRYNFVSFLILNSRSIDEHDHIAFANPMSDNLKPSSNDANNEENNFSTTEEFYDGPMHLFSWRGISS